MTDHPAAGVPGDPDRPYTGWARTLGELEERFPPLAAGQVELTSPEALPASDNRGTL